VSALEKAVTEQHEEADIERVIVMLEMEFVNLSEGTKESLGDVELDALGVRMWNTAVRLVSMQESLFKDKKALALLVARIRQVGLDAVMQAATLDFDTRNRIRVANLAVKAGKAWLGRPSFHLLSPSLHLLIIFDMQRARIL